MKVILFIGHHKVGSSALQTYLARNAVGLLRQGILYPAVEAHGLATLLALALNNHNELTEPLPINLREAHNALAFGMMAAHDKERYPIPALHDGLPPAEEMLMVIRRQIEVFAPDTVILAAEVFANFAAVSPVLIDQLRRFFDGAEITLTASLRQIDDYLVSWHSQRLRFGQAPRSLPGGALQLYYKGIHFDYRSMLEGWLVGMPEARLRLRPYDEVLTSGGAVQDFLGGFDIAPVKGVLTESWVNRGLHRGLIEIARHANQDLASATAHEVLRTLLRLGQRLDLPATDSVELFGADARTGMATRFAPIHDWLSNLSGATTSGGAFFAGIADTAVLRLHHEHDVNQDALAQIRKRWLFEFPADAREFLNGLTLTPNFPRI